jgi:hypothetical protein
MGETYGPFNVRCGVLQRSTNFVDLVVRQRPGTTAFRLWGSTSLAEAYGTLTGSNIAGSGGVNLLEAPVGGMAQSATVIRRNWRVEENRRGQTSFQFDSADYLTGLAPFPTDDQIVYLRVQEKRGGVWTAITGAIDNGIPIRGPILIVPNPAAYGQAAAVLSLQTNAPTGTTCVAGTVPVVDPTVQIPLPMHIVMPRPAATLTITNQHAQDDLLVSFGLDQPMFIVGPGATSIPTGGGFSLAGVRELVVASNTGDVIPFSIEMVIANEVG